MSTFNRRQLLQTGAAAAFIGTTSPAALTQQAASAKPSTPIHRKNNIHQSVSRWCYKATSLEDLCAYAAKIGLVGVDLLQPEEFEVPPRYGLLCTMGYVGAGDIKREHHS